LLYDYEVCVWSMLDWLGSLLHRYGLQYDMRVCGPSGTFPQYESLVIATAMDAYIMQLVECAAIY